ncbi:alpha/beta fold hydrolase [Streptomyces sp. NPDC088747]|uniref:alpha/beta fold hydrolase n=1 Tax=Streptomyces sp. NPDC088747 TaxID=3365886 RepID=UPI0037FF39BF
MTTDQDPLVPGLLSRSVRLSTGAKVHYVTSGEHGPNVILLHGGLPGSSGTAGFRLMAPFLGSQGFRVFAPDQPTFGHTEDPYGAYAHGQGGSVDFVHDFANALALDTFHLGGNSLGCTNSANYALAHPERVDSLALIAGGLGDIVPREDMTAADPRSPEDRPKPRPWDGRPETMRAILEGVVLSPETVTDELVAMRTAAAIRHDGRNQEFFARWRAPHSGGSNPDERARLRTKDRLDQLTIPAIYLHGKEDVSLHVAGAYLLEDALPDIQFFYPENTGHQGQTDQPELFNQVFLEFFRDGVISQATARRAGVSTRRPASRLVEAGPAA